MAHSKKWVSALLTSASLLTLSIASIGRASAAGTTRTGPGPQTIAGHFDWVNIDGPTPLSSFTNTGQISDGFTNPDSNPDFAEAVHIRSGANVSSFINGPGGLITAIMGTAPSNGGPTDDATAIGVNVDGFLGSLTNQGSIKAVAQGVNFDGSSGVFAGATGINWDWNTSSTTPLAATLTSSASILAQANAVAIGSTYQVAVAEATGIDQFLEQSASVSSVINNTGAIAANAAALAEAQGFAAIAVAGATGVSQEAQVFGPGATASVAMGNSGSISALAVGSAGGIPGVGLPWNAFATYVGARGVGQFAESSDEGAGATASLTNNGSITATGLAIAVATDTYARARAFALGVGQGAEAFGSPGSATVSLTNNGQIIATAVATAGGGFEEGVPQAPFAAMATYVNAVGVNQFSQSEFAGASSSLVNNGTISATLIASAAGATSYARANGFAFGVEQFAQGQTVATADLTNNGSILASATVSAGGLQLATGAQVLPRIALATYAYAGGVVQSVESYGSPAAPGFVSIGSLVNTGSIQALSNAKAIAGTYAAAKAVALGVQQIVKEGDFASASLINDGTSFKRTAIISASLNATATGQSASANGFALGVFQVIESGSAMSASVTNTGSILATAIVSAHATSGTARATAVATGVRQQFGLALLSETASLFNESSGVIAAHAVANAFGTPRDDAHAFAAGVVINDDVGSGPEDSADLHLSFVNDGLIAALAEANANTYAGARAVGVSAFSDDTIDGSLVNNGTIAARAFVNGGGGSHAQATGVFVGSDGSNNAAIVNNGTIYAYAQAAAGGSAYAAGIYIDDEPAPTGLATVINHGTIFAGWSNDGGATVNWGDAINTELAPNPVLISLQDPPLEHGYIFGNIVTGPSDTIVVNNGATWFSGIINQGNPIIPVTIQSGGKLLLLNQDPGPSQVFASTFTVDPGGILAMQLGVDTAPAANPQVFATTANLGGTFVADYLPGLYGDAFTYTQLINSTNPLTTQFAAVADNSALLNTQAVYLPNEMDLTVTRTPFGAVSGLSHNQQAVGNALEKVYPQVPAGNPAFANIIANLFALNDGDYPHALNALSGAEYAQQLQSLLWSPATLNATITDRMDCGANWRAGGGKQSGASAGAGRDGCFEPGHYQAWARVTGSWNKNDGDSNAPGYNESLYNLIAGADYAITSRWFAGVAIGYLGTSMDFDDWGHVGGASIDYRGPQFALYGGYDDSIWYGRAIATFATFDGTSHRNIAIGPSLLDPSGSPDATVASFYGEAGRRFQWQAGTTITPFAGVSIAHAHLDGFTEDDPYNSGGALRVDSSNGDSAAGVLGLRINGQWGAWRPEASLAWQHEFLDTTQSVHNTLVSAPAGGNFSVISSDAGRDSALLSLGTTYTVNATSDFTVKYDGRFSSGYSANAVTGRWTTKF